MEMASVGGFGPAPLITKLYARDIYRDESSPPISIRTTTTMEDRDPLRNKILPPFPVAPLGRRGGGSGGAPGPPGAPFPIMPVPVPTVPISHPSMMARSRKSALSDISEASFPETPPTPVTAVVGRGRGKGRGRGSLRGRDNSFVRNDTEREMQQAYQTVEKGFDTTSGAEMGVDGADSGVQGVQGAEYQSDDSSVYSTDGERSTIGGLSRNSSQKIATAAITAGQMDGRPI